jgi:phosphatidylserine decarboxylase
MSRNDAATSRPRGRLPIAHEGWPFIFGCLALLVVSAVFYLWVALLLTVLLLFMLNFFRDPNREVPQGEDLFVAPADGKVVRAEQTKSGCRIDIFMNIFNVHVNRSPMAGRITHMQYSPGRFINASFDSASEENERNRFEMQTDTGERIAFTQIAGLVARRIVSYVAVGDHVEAGQRIGMIRFGSRVDCEVPAGYELCVKPGDHTVAGRTILARKGGGKDHAED